MSKQAWPVFLIMLLGDSPAMAQVALEWQFKVGETFFAERIYTQNQAVEINGKVFKELRSKTWLTLVTVKEKTKAGFVLELKIEAADFTPGDKLADKIKGGIFKVTVTRQGKVSKFEGYDAFIQKLADKNAEVEKTLRIMLSEEGFREDINEIFNFLPEKAVRNGDKWKREAIEPIPPFGTLKSTYEYVLEDDNMAELGIGLTIKTTYRPPANEGDLFKVIKGSLKGEEGKGTIIFDAQNGRLVRSNKTVLVRGELVIESLGRQTKMDFTSDNNLRVRIFSK